MDDSSDIMRVRVTRHAVAWGLRGLFLGGVTTYLPFTARRLGASPTLVAIVTGVPMVALLVAFLYVHYLEHLESRKLVAVPRIVGCAILLSLCLARHALVFCLIASIGMLIFALSNPFYGHLLNRLYPPQRRGRLLIWPMLSLSLMTIVANLFVGRLLDHSVQSFQWVLPAVATFGIAGGFMIMRFPVNAKGIRLPQRRLMTCLREGFGDRRFLVWTLLYSLMAVGWWVATPAVAIYFNDELRVTNVGFGTAQACFNIAMLLGFFIAGPLLDRSGSVTTICLGWSAIAIGMLVLAVGRSLPLAMVGLGIQGLGMAANDIAWYPVVLEYAPKDRVHRYMGFYMTMFGLRAVVGTGLAALLMDVVSLGSRSAIGLAAATTGGTAVVILSMRRHLRNPRPSP